LRERLRDIFAIRVERVAYLEADNDIDFQDVADVIAIARIAGVDRVGLLTEDGRHAGAKAKEARTPPAIAPCSSGTSNHPSLGKQTTERRHSHSPPAANPRLLV
jgi:hypothetical protein